MLWESRLIPVSLATSSFHLLDDNPFSFCFLLHHWFDWWWLPEGGPASHLCPHEQSALDLSAGSQWVSYIAEWASRIFSRSQVQTGTIWVTICMSVCQHFIEYICQRVRETWGRLGTPRRTDWKTDLRRRLSQTEWFPHCEPGCNSVGFPSLIHGTSRQQVRRLCSCLTPSKPLWREGQMWKVHPSTSKFPWKVN